jgi:magnesium transporter
MIRSVFRFRAGDPVDTDAGQGFVPMSDADASALADVARACREESATDAGSFVWVKAQDPTDAEWQALTEIFALPPLQVADARNPMQRPRVEYDDARVFLILKELRYVARTSDVETGQVSVFIGPGYAVSVRHGDAAPGSSRARLAREPELARHGPVSVLYAVTDVIVGGYLTVSHELDNDVSQVEDRVFQGAADNTAGVIYRLKRENLELRRALAPLLLVSRRLTRDDDLGAPHGLRHHFQTLGEEVLRAYELADSHDQLLMAMLMAMTSQQELSQNSDMRKISAWAAIIAVPTAVAGVYGMNFPGLPAADRAWGFPAVLAAMAAMCVVLYIVFKRSNWL